LHKSENYHCTDNSYTSHCKQVFSLHSCSFFDANTAFQSHYESFCTVFQSPKGYQEEKKKLPFGGRGVFSIFDSGLSPECGEDRSKNGIDNQSQNKVVAEDAVMHEADRRKPARPNGVAGRRLTRARI